MTKEEIYIRKLEEKDWKLFRAMRIEATYAHANFFLDSGEVSEAKEDQFWKDRLTDQNGAIFGLFDGDNLIGITGAFRFRERPEDTVILGMSYIKPDYRGRGLSELFYKERLDWSRHQSGIARVIVSHRKENAASKAANQKFGFIRYGEDEVTFGDGSRGMDIRYELIL